MCVIVDVKGREILDSRGNPTVEVDITLDSGDRGRASCPSGASTGSHEAFELRDKGDSRYAGKGVQSAVRNVNSEISNLLLGLNPLNQREIDNALIELDGTKNKSRLGANAILAASIATAKASSNYLNLELYQYLGGPLCNRMPYPMVNIINGGMHANNSLAVQEFMIIPVSGSNFAESLRMSAEVFYCLKSILSKQGYSTAVGDEGGFAPANLESNEQAIEIIIQAIEKAGYKPGVDIHIALDAAASEFYNSKKMYQIDKSSTLSSDQLLDYWGNLIAHYPILSIEDPFHEDDWEAWSAMTKALSTKVQIVGDDLFVTNQERLDKGINSNAANSILIKINQIGTITESVDTILMAQRNNYSTVISHRSGETEDTTIADLAVAFGAGQIKTGSISRTDRICKYNRLLRIEEQLGSNAQMIYPFHVGN